MAIPALSFGTGRGLPLFAEALSWAQPIQAQFETVKLIPSRDPNGQKRSQFRAIT